MACTRTKAAPQEIFSSGNLQQCKSSAEHSDGERTRQRGVDVTSHSEGLPCQHSSLCQQEQQQQQQQ